MPPVKPVAAVTHAPVSRCGRSRPAARCARRRRSPTLRVRRLGRRSRARVRPPADRVLEEPLADRCALDASRRSRDSVPIGASTSRSTTGSSTSLTISRTGVNAYSRHEQRDDHARTQHPEPRRRRHVGSERDDFRLITGLAVAGTRIGAGAVRRVERPARRRRRKGTVTDLDTNSGIISRLTRSGSTWTKLDLVRGLPALRGEPRDERARARLRRPTRCTSGRAATRTWARRRTTSTTSPSTRTRRRSCGSTSTRSATSTYDLPTLTDEDHPGSDRARSAATPASTRRRSSRAVPCRSTRPVSAIRSRSCRRGRAS